jgi:hypothetical protein
MIKKKILFLIFVIKIFLLFNLTLAQFNITNPVEVTSSESWRYFYQYFRPAADVSCLEGSSALERINNCLIKVLSALQYLAIILFVISLTLIAGFLVFSPVNKSYLETARKTFFWTILGFIIIFIAKEVLIAINQLVK